MFEIIFYKFKRFKRGYEINIDKNINIFFMIILYQI